MGGWYYVTKVIRGVPYRYAQTSWREGKRVRTTCRCLGRADSFGTRAATEDPTQTSKPRGNTTAAVDSTPLPATDDRRSLRDALVNIRSRIEPARCAIETIDRLLGDFDTLTLPSLVRALSKIASEMTERHAQEGILELLAQVTAGIGTRERSELEEDALRVADFVMTTLNDPERG